MYYDRRRLWSTSAVGQELRPLPYQQKRLSVLYCRSETSVSEQVTLKYCIKDGRRTMKRAAAYHKDCISMELILACIFIRAEGLIPRRLRRNEGY